MCRTAFVLLVVTHGALLAENDAQSLFRQGVTAVREHRLQAAEQAFRTAIELQPGLIAARKNLGTVLWFLNRHSESEGEFRIVMKAAPQDPVPHLYLGLAEAARREFIRATSHFEQAGDLALNNPETRPAVLRAYTGAAEQYDRQGLPEKALNAYQRALSLDPDAIPAYVALAAFASAHGNNEYALKTLKSGLERKPGSAVLLLEQGIVQALQGLFDEAEASLRAAAQADPEMPIALLATGVTQLQRGHAAEAVATFHAAKTKWPQSGRAQYLYALALERTGDAEKRDEVRAALRTAIRLDAKDAGAHALLGHLLLENKQPGAAAAELETAVKLDPSNGTAFYQLATAYRALGRTADVQRVLEQFRKVKSKAKAQESELVQLLKIVPAR